jgi:hypothetical protein
MRELRPVPDPSGALQPPRRDPPTAVGVETPEPEPQPRQRARFAGLWAPRPSLLPDLLQRALKRLRGKRRCLARTAGTSLQPD